MTQLPLIFVWDNIGPMHADRIEAVAQKLNAHNICYAIEEAPTSNEYDWVGETRSSFKKISLTTERNLSSVRLFLKLLKLSIRFGRAHWFLCNYERPHIIMFSIWLAITAQRPVTMGCSKFDDTHRSASKEFIKRLLLMPYRGAIGSGTRSRAYFRFLGIKNVVGVYNTLSVDRIRNSSGIDNEASRTAYEVRHFTIVARLVPKKNLLMALDAYASYFQSVEHPRPLHICGNGPLSSALQKKTRELGISKMVVFHGFLQTHDVAALLSESVALILPSTEEQFGNVVIEAQAAGLPVLLSEACGAKDHLIRNWHNGFVFEPDNPYGLSQFMKLVSNDKSLWEDLSAAATRSAIKGDVSEFSNAVESLTNTR
ncbi:glycosyltransferase [Thalassorhabdomicrobium marinisediminis]|uniref:glycosyltransferase n=1 Tax=Thalassorhabdomicrobium marinisediminis TaxID=2170577 RepID=UPI0024914758|nr:glycosyltransferase [Thalassorhabdomicrobium marinisediminis]